MPRVPENTQPRQPRRILANTCQANDLCLEWGRADSRTAASFNQTDNLVTPSHVGALNRVGLLIIKMQQYNSGLTFIEPRWAILKDRVCQKHHRQKVEGEAGPQWSTAVSWEKSVNSGQKYPNSVGLEFPEVWVTLGRSHLTAAAKPANDELRH